jgi:hypothetical protein
MMLESEGMTEDLPPEDEDRCYQLAEQKIWFRGLELIFPMSYSSDAYICSLLSYETCDDTYSMCILVQLADLMHPVFPTFPTLGLQLHHRLVFLPGCYYL